MTLSQSGPNAGAGVPPERYSDDLVFRALLERIGSLKVGDRLPAERELSHEFAVSRTMLRDRLQSLEALGLVERRVGSGAFVQAIAPETVATVLSLGLAGSDLTIASMQSVRVALERQAAFEAAARAVPAPMAVMATMVKRMEQTSDPRELYDADVAFHRALFEASESPALVFFSQALASVLARSVELRLARMRRLTDDTAVIRDVHRDVYDAILSGDASEAMAAIDRHFTVLAEFDRDIAGQ